MTSQPEATEITSAGRESAAAWLVLAVVVAAIAFMAYWVGGVALEGFRSLGRM